MRISRRRRRARREMIISFSPGPNVTPYAFDSKGYNDDAGHLESAYTPTINSTNLVNVNGTANTIDRTLSGDRLNSSRRVPSFYHASGVASTVKPPIPRIDVEYLTTTRGTLDDGFDTFNCAMYPADTCPLEHENRIGQLASAGATGLRVTNLPGSPVPSFQTDRPDDPHSSLPYYTTYPALPSTDGEGRMLIPPRPQGRLRHIPTPLVFSPSIDQWTNSVRGFTPRRSHTTASNSTSTTISSSPSAYSHAPDRF